MLKVSFEKYLHETLLDEGLYMFHYGIECAEC